MPDRMLKTTIVKGNVHDIYGLWANFENFPHFMDGRAYSTAVILRKHFHYEGELRAIGDVLRDQLFMMKRCGFTTFDLRDTVKLEDAQTAFSDFTTNYQATVETPEPLFRRREL